MFTSINCGDIDAMKWESLGYGTHRLLLYRSGEQAVLVFTEGRTLELHLRRLGAAP
jgi:hypothetical protein